MFGGRHNKEMQESFERCLAMLRQGAKVEDCLAAYPAQATDLRPLLATARAVNAAASLTPRPEAKLAGKARLQQAIQARLATQPAIAAKAPADAEIEHLLNTCLERMRLGETMEQCLADYPAFATALRPLLAASRATQVLFSAQPRPEAKAMGMARLQAAINAKLAQAAAKSQPSEAEFESILNTCLERLSRGATMEMCLASYPHLAERLRPLLQTAIATQATYRVKPSQKAKALGRVKLRQSASRGSGGGVWRMPTAILPLRAWAASAAVLVLMLGGYGVVQAAEGAKPDSILYPVKRTVEDVQQNAPFRSEGSKAQLAGQFADRRTDEIAYLAEKGESAKIEGLTEDLNKQVTRLVQFQTKSAQKEVNRLQAKIDAQMPPVSVDAPSSPGEPATATPPPTRPAASSSPEPTRPLPTRALPSPEQTRPAVSPEASRPLAVLTVNDQSRIEKQRQNLEQSKAKLTEQYQKYVEKLEEARKSVAPERTALLDATLQDRKVNYDRGIGRLDQQLSSLSAIESNAAIIRPQDSEQVPPVTRPATRPPTQVPPTRPATLPPVTRPPTQVPPTRPATLPPATRPVNLTPRPVETRPPTEPVRTLPPQTPPPTQPPTRPPERTPPTLPPQRSPISNETPAARTPELRTVPPQTRPASQQPTTRPATQLPATRPVETRPPTQPPTRPPTQPARTQAPQLVPDNRTRPPEQTRPQTTPVRNQENPTRPPAAPTSRPPEQPRATAQPQATQGNRQAPTPPPAQPTGQTQRSSGGQQQAQTATAQ